MVEKKTEPWLVWMWRYHNLGVDTYEDLDTALSVAIGIEEDGDGVLDCIEGPDGVISDDVIKAARAARDEEWRREYESQPKYTHRVDLLSPDGKHTAGLSWHETRAAADEEAEALRSRFGDRVKVARIPR